jgi:hypothetical protein
MRRKRTETDVMLALLAFGVVFGILLNMALAPVLHFVTAGAP